MRATIYLSTTFWTASGWPKAHSIVFCLCGARLVTLFGTFSVLDKQVHFSPLYHHSSGTCSCKCFYQKVEMIAAERNEDLQVDFIWCMTQYEPEQLGFLDEYLKDERTSSWWHGRLWKGTHAVKKGVFICGWCFSVEGLLKLDRMVSNTVVEGSMTHVHFLQYLELEVVLYCYFSIYMCH